MLRSLVCTLAVCLLSAVVLASTVEIDADASTDFAAYETFELELGTPPRTTKASKELTSAIRKAFKKRGLEPVDAAGDVVVRAHVLVDAHSLEELSDEAQWEFWTGVRNISPIDMGEGTLVIDVIDRESARIVWRGLTTEKLGTSTEAIYRRLPKIVRRLSNRYPARP